MKLVSKNCIDALTIVVIMCLCKYRDAVLAKNRRATARPNVVTVVATVIKLYM